MEHAIISFMRVKGSLQNPCDPHSPLDHEGHSVWSCEIFPVQIPLLGCDVSLVGCSKNENNRPTGSSAC